MWICFNDSFVSVVRDPEADGRLLVRARRRKDLWNALGAEYSDKIVQTPGRDYRFRVSLPAEVVARCVYDEIRGIDYGNFKNSVADKDLHKMYALWWGDHLELDPAKRVSPKAKGKK